MTTSDVVLFIDAYDHAAAPGIERSSVGGDSAEHHAVRTERHLAGLLHMQVQQFFLGLEAALRGRIVGPVERSRLLQVGLAAALEFGLESDEGSPALFDMFAFMNQLGTFPFDAQYGAGFAPDGSVTIVVGPELPALAETGIGGSREHDEADLRIALAVARECTRFAAELKARADWGDGPAASERNDPDEHAGSTQDAAEAAFLQELCRATARHFTIWYAGSEDAWVRFALEVLASKGLISAATEEDRARAAGRAMTLWALHLEFAARGGEGSPGDWTYEVGFWANDGVDEDQLRLLNDVYELGWEFDDEEDEISLSEVCRDDVQTHHDEVTATLVSELGENFLFASMWATRMEDIVYPLDGDIVYDLTNTDASGDKADAYMWVTDGMPL